MQTYEEQRLNYLKNLSNLSIEDGREVLFTLDLGVYLSEYALHRYRAHVELQNLIDMGQSGLKGFPKCSNTEIENINKVLADFNPKIVAQYDRFGYNEKGPFEHDVKAVETHLRDLFDQYELSHLKEFIHFPCTSEDINNLAWNLMLRDAINHVWLPQLLAVCDQLATMAKEFAIVPVIGKTHGMNASPTTFGKRFAYFLARFSNIIDTMQQLTLTGKYSGAVGNDNAMTFVAPDFNFAEFAERFVGFFGMDYSECENQRNSHVAIVRILNEINLVNILAIDLCENIRNYVSVGWLDQVGKESNVGSSVMPHKINPWFFENACGVLEQSVALISNAGMGLIPSAYERDLSDHAWERSYGQMIGKNLIGLGYILEGLKSLRVNDVKALEELKTTPEVLTEAVQIAGRLLGENDIYMKIKALARGRSIDLELLHVIINENISDPETRERLKSLSPENYVGRAPQIALDAVKRYEDLKGSAKHGVFHPVAGIAAVLFDLDGTLQMGDKLEVHARFTEISKNLGMEFESDEIDHFINRSDYREMRKLILQAHNIRIGVNQITEDEFQNENNRVSGKYDHLFYLADGALELLNILKTKGYKIGLVTTRGGNSLPRLLRETHKIDHYFDVIINRDDAKERKPHPQPIALALEKLGISPYQAMYIGDKQVDDVIAGNALGMMTCLIDPEPVGDLYGARPNFSYGSILGAADLFRYAT
jgi:adenylosuccinate lyase